MNIKVIEFSSYLITILDIKKTFSGLAKYTVRNYLLTDELLNDQY